MKNKLLLSGAILIALFNLTGCGEDNSNAANTTDTTVAPVETTTQNNQNSVAQSSSTTTKTSEAPVSTSKPATASNKTLAPGTYCYKANTKTINAGAEVNINSNNRVNGKIKGTSDFNFIGASDNYSRTFEGTLTGNKAKLTAETRIEVEILNYQGNWTITESSLITDKATYNKVDCSTLTSTSENDSALYNDPGDRTIRVKFDRGASSKTVKDSVIRGTRDIYLLGANKGQQMNLNITSLEDNAVFDVVSPNGQILQQEVRNWSGKLPANGDYQVVVGGTRGNATYELTTEIK